MHSSLKFTTVKLGAKEYRYLQIFDIRYNIRSQREQLDIGFKKTGFVHA